MSDRLGATLAAASEGLNLGQDAGTDISSTTLLRLLGGVVVATKCADQGTVSGVETWIASVGSERTNRSWLDWLTLADGAFPADGGDSIGDKTRQVGATTYARHLVRLTVAIGHLRNASRRNVPVAPETLGQIWAIVRDALTGIQDTTNTAASATGTTRPLGAAMRSSQGFLHVPLYSIVKDGDIDELIRLHVWLPGKQSPADAAKNGEVGAFTVHSHQPFAQSWILAGEGTDHPYAAEPVDTAGDATHARYALSWTGPVDGKDNGNDTDTGTVYKTHQTASTVRNRGLYVRATPLAPVRRGPGSTYTIPAAAYHWTEAAPGALHATLFFFDASRGFVRDADVLGPVDGDGHTQVRDPAGVTAAALASAVERVRQWEAHMSRARAHARRADWEPALHELDKALALTSEADDGAGKSADDTLFPNAAHYRCTVHGEMGSTNRRFGRYDVAAGFLEAALAEMARGEAEDGHATGPQRLEVSGELGVVYRHMGRLRDAEHVLQIQYTTALALGADAAACRAIGNLGMVNYQLSQEDPRQAGQIETRSEDPNQDRLATAIEQLQERVARARRLGNDPHAALWEAIGLQRLALCYAATGRPGDTRRGVESAEAAFALTADSPDPTVVAFSSLFLGRALAADQTEQTTHADRVRAAKYLSGAWLPAGRCTPAIALCKEPSAEHRSYLAELIAFSASHAECAGLDAGLDAVDENGYTALDYCVFNGDGATEALVVEALHRQLHARADSALAERRTEARLRKGYRELFQDVMRPVLLSTKDKGAPAVDTLTRLRSVYANALDASPASPGYRGVFDDFKCVPYRAFAVAGHLPGGADNLARRVAAPVDGGTVEDSPDSVDAVDYVVFISYRWINVTRDATAPDDAAHTQYRRICAAVEAFLQRHADVTADRLGLWIDHACVDQTNPAPGIAALPMLVAQCNAVISLTSADYYDRAWCSVEVMMAQVLCRAYGLHAWYEHVVDADSHGTLRPGPMDIEINMAHKVLAFESDRPRILFLERQAKLLG
ncbi:hypothetical protein SPBR_04067 [Sporothrix brasiliensis 5110]|uniref:Uncharacterized protein n=1 Tax=Sporothrix brasiliensis 5110 TaxID=1398154 RepID=A0A0C2FQJ5_9PEZI|nr:uncharacterized protein SPBR_04067 [Sporothrix brasiliensis 5110]KIH93323.1 hypothetical protein SPBR_04067 [Sporothrix brasiliensis 5110]